MVKYLKKHKCYISTSLDGPKDLHNTNRPLQNTNHTHEKFEENVNMIREICGPHSVSALMTTSVQGLNHPVEIVDEYAKLGFKSLFLRALNPYGLASDNPDWEDYTRKFIGFYKK